MNDSIISMKDQSTENLVPNPMVATQLSKDDLLYRVAHDLKNTLTAAHLTLTKVNLYRERMTDEQVDESVGRALWTLNSMAETVTNIVRLNRIEEEIEAVVLDSAEFVSLTETYIDHTRSIAKTKNITLTSELPKDESILVQIDSVYYRTILNNLISNAIKFSPDNSEVFFRLENDEKKARLSIIDQGQGLIEEDFEKLFTRFSKLSAKPTSGEASTGLGLYLSHRLVTAMNGTLEAQSEGKNKGSQFILTFDVIGK